MDLILKPNLACNFKCTFCSSTNIAPDTSTTLSLDIVREFLIRYPRTRTIIINGGDPLIVQPSYYFKLIELLDELKMNSRISFTSNLYPFYLKPEKWLDLFLHPRVGVNTSFQYQGRLKHDLTNYTEEEFWKVSNLFLDKVGYRPDFISVITNETMNDSIRLVELAKKMNVVCKLNYANGSGKVVEFKGIKIGNENNAFITAKAYRTYVEIFDKGLADYEFNTQQLIKTLFEEHTICPLSIECDSGIRCLQPNGDYYSCGSFGDDQLYPIDFKEEMSGKKILPIQQDYSIRVMKEECYTCFNFKLCNGCKRSVYDMKNQDSVDIHCKIMKSLIPDFIRIKESSR